MKFSDKYLFVLAEKVLKKPAYMPYHITHVIYLIPKINGLYSKSIIPFQAMLFWVIFTSSQFRIGKRTYMPFSNNRSYRGVTH